MDYASLSDDQIKQMLGSATPSAAPAVAPDYSTLSDDEIKQRLEVPAAPRKGSTIPMSFENMKHDAGTILKDAASIPGQIYEGGKAVVGRVAHDVTAPKDAIADAVSVLRKINPFSGGYDAVKQGIDFGKSAIADPKKAARDLGTFVAEHPVQAGLTAAFPASGGELTAGRAALALPTRTLAGVDRAVVRPATELLSGVSSDAQRLASRAGELGGAEGRAFRENMAHPDWQGMKDTGVQGVTDMRAARSVQDNIDRTAWNAASGNNLNLTPTIREAQAARADAYGPGGFVRQPAVLPVMDEIDQAIREFQAANPVNGGRNAEMLDALKQRINGIARGLDEGSPERRAAERVFGSVRQELGTVPGYAGGMERYGVASDNINEAVKSLGLKDSATRFSTSGKLLSAMRSDASVARGSREETLAHVAQHQPTLPFQIAGATMNPMLPRGIVGRGSALLHAGGVGGAAAFMPALLAALPALALASPRLVGNARYAAGSTVRGARAVGATQRNAGISAEILRQLSQFNPQSNQNQ